MADLSSIPLLERLWHKHWGKLLFAQILVVFCLGYLARGGTSSSAGKQPGDGHAGHPREEKEKPLFWSCSMHPEVQLPGPGKCTKCPMDLLPVYDTSDSRQPPTGLRQFVTSEAARELMKIQTVPVEHRFVTANVRMVGKIDHDETRLKHVTARVPGRLDRLYVDYTGIQVKQNDHMVYIYSEQLYTAQQELIEAAKSARNRPKSNFFAPGIDLVKSAREKLRLLGITPDQISEIEKQGKPSDHLTIYAPIGGIVVEKFKEEGDRVQVGERIYTVADLSRLWVRLDAYESDLPWIRYGQKVTFTTESMPGEAFAGTIAFIDPVLNAKTRTVKVRVNVENLTGRLKPEMFVRAVVHSQVASRGRVMDAALAGKWISPMHPEIIRDKPGKCDICGMPLVRAESLGYVPLAGGDANKPLVIPVSAALITGTRAIVYVEDPKAEEPTFEGREIVLGPRAGDYYLVKHGLQVGELVVTNGNFKIDSALQIRLAPSMMTPAGGGSSGHDHAEHAGRQTATKWPVRFEDRLYDLLAELEQVRAAAKSGKPEQARAAFAAFGRVYEKTDGSALRDHPQLVWKELAMLLSNDIVEGRDVTDVAAMNRLAAGLTASMARVRQQFGLDPAARGKLVVSEAFQGQLAGLWQAYQTLGEALAADKADRSKQAVARLGSAFQSVDMKLLTDENAHGVWMKERENLVAILKSLREAKDINALRESFSLLSGEMYALVRTFGIGKNRTVYQHHCPMAFKNRGAAWLQADEETRNPYFGSMMLKCADHVELIFGDKPVPDETAPNKNDDGKQGGDDNE